LVKLGGGLPEALFYFHIKDLVKGLQNFNKIGFCHQGIDSDKVLMKLSGEPKAFIHISSFNHIYQKI